VNTFKADIAAFAKKANESADKTVRMVSLELFTAIIKSTPVGDPSLWQDQEAAARAVANGYVGGRARGNWQSSVGSSESGVIDGVREESAAISALEAGIGGAGEVTYLTNNLPYIMPLEEGHSSQAAPAAMVRGNMERVSQMIAKAVAQNRV
jgi:hypothetical protein